MKTSPPILKSEAENGKVSMIRVHTLITHSKQLAYTYG